MENRYINEDSGSLKSEIVGGLTGGALGSLGINATQAFQKYKAEKAEIEQLKQELPELEGSRQKVQNAFDDASMLHRIKENPRVLDDLSDDAKAYYSSVYDAAERLQGRSDFDRINELPFRERVNLFIKGKPSIRDVDPELLDHVVGKFGERPFDGDVVNTLRQQGGKIDDNIQLLREVTQFVPKYDLKGALPTLDQFRPKNLIRTVSHPMVAGGAMVGYGAGVFRDEYKQHLALVKERRAGGQEMPKEAGFSSVFKKLLPTKPLVAPEVKQTAKKSLIPKSVKRTGLLLGGAGVAGYSAIKAKDDFTAGMKMTPSAQKLEGMDSNMKKTAELYAELEKVALSVNGIKDGAKAIADKAKGQAGNLKDVVTGKGVKKAEDALESRKVMSGITGEPVGDVAAKNLTKEKVKRVGAIAGIGGAGAGVAGAAAGSAVSTKREKTAKELYEDLEKFAKEMDQEKSEYALKHPISKTVKDGAKWGAIAGLPFFGVGAIPGALGGAAFGLEQGLSRSLANQELAKEDGMDPRLAGGLMGGGVAVGTNIPSALRAATRTRAMGLSPVPGLVGSLGSTALVGGGIGALIGNNQEKHYNNVHSGEFETTQSLSQQHKKASELYEELSKVAGIGESVKKAVGEAKNIVTGKNVEKAQGVLDNRLKMHGATGEAIGRVAPHQLKKEKAKRAGALAGIGVAGAAATGGVAVGVDRQRKTASELYDELLKEAGALQGLKNLGGKLAGKPAKQIERYQAELGDSAHLQKHLESAKASTNKARAGVAGGVGLVGAGVAGGVMATKAGQEKKANEEVEYADKGVIPRGALVGAGVGAGAGLVGGTAIGRKIAQEFGENALNTATVHGLMGTGSGALGGSLIGAGVGGAVYLSQKAREEQALREQEALSGHDNVAADESTEIEKVAHEAINSLFGDKVDAILEDKLEKIASHTDPLDRITFGYENLKK